MAHCSINLADEPDGAIAMRVVHTDGYCAESPAHKLSTQIIKWLDEQADTKEELDDNPTPIVADEHGRPLE